MIASLKQAVKDSGKSLKSLAEITGISESTVSRYLSGDQTPTFEFVVKVAETLGLSLDELTGNPTGAKHAAENAMLEQIKAVYDQRIEDKNAHIASQKSRIERMETAHAAEIERIETAHAAEIERLQNAHDRELNEKKTSRYIKDTLLVLAFGGLVFYLLWDLTHPSEGMIQYQVYARQLSQWMTDIFTL